MDGQSSPAGYRRVGNKLRTSYYKTASVPHAMVIGILGELNSTFMQLKKMILYFKG